MCGEPEKEPVNEGNKKQKQKQPQHSYQQQANNSHRGLKKQQAEQRQSSKNQNPKIPDKIAVPVQDSSGSKFTLLKTLCQVLVRQFKKNKTVLGGFMVDDPRAVSFEKDPQQLFTFTLDQLSNQKFKSLEKQIDFIRDQLISIFRTCFQGFKFKKQLAENVQTVLKLIIQTLEGKSQSEKQLFDKPLRQLKELYKPIFEKIEQIISLILNLKKSHQRLKNTVEQNEKANEQSRINHSNSNQSNSFPNVRNDQGLQSNHLQRKLHSFEQRGKLLIRETEQQKQKQFQSKTQETLSKREQNNGQKENEKLKIEVQNLKAQYYKSDQQKAELKQMIDRLQAQKAKLKEENDLQKARLKAQAQQLNSERVKGLKQVAVKQNQLRQLTAKLQSLAGQLSWQQQSLQYAREGNQKLTHQKSQLLSQLARMEEEKRRANLQHISQIQQLMQASQRDKNIIRQLLEQSTQLEDQDVKKTLKIHQLQDMLRQLAEEKKKNQLKLALNESLQLQISQLKVSLKQEVLFFGQVLEKKSQEKAFLIEAIESHMKKNIQKSYLLYDIKKDQKTLFHQRIDGKSNLVIIVQTEKALFAGYYSGKYGQGIYMTEEALIISLTNKKRYRLNNFANNPRKNPKDTKPIYGMVYDQFFLIFGNSEIRVKPGDKDRKIFSNFGVSNSYFNNEGDTVDKLLCEGKTAEVQITSYQVYEVIFSEEEYVQKVNKDSTAEKMVVQDRANQQFVIRGQEEQKQKIQIVAQSSQQFTRYEELLLQPKEKSARFKAQQLLLNQQIARLASSNETFSKQIQSLKQEHDSLSTQLRNKQLELDLLSKKNEESIALSLNYQQKVKIVQAQLLKLKAQFSAENQELKIKIFRLQGELAQLKKQYQTETERLSLEAFKKQHQVFSQKLKAKISQQEAVSYLSAHSHIKGKAEQASTNQESRIQQLQNVRLLEQLKQKHLKLLQLHNELAHSKDSLKTQIDSLKAENDSLKAQNDGKTKMLQQKANQLRQKEHEISRLEEYIRRLEAKIQEGSSKNQEIEQLKQLNIQLQERIQTMQYQSSKLRRQSFVEHVTLFAGKILENQKQQKKFLIACIEKHMKKEVGKTELLYDNKKDYKYLFHQRIDGKSNLVIVVQTEKALFAGYYSGKYAQGIFMTAEALIISLTNKKRYCLNNFANNPKKNRKDTRPIYGMVYDKFFLIFGNSEIRVKPGDKDCKVFSNFGVSNSYFNNEGDTVDKLLCEGKTAEIETINYQIYEVTLTDDLQQVQRE